MQQRQKRKLQAELFIPDTAKEKPQRGVVVAVGTGKKDEPITVKRATPFFTVNMPVLKSPLDQELLIMRESDILAVI